MKLISRLFIFALFFVSCSSNTVFEDYKSFENQSWNADSTVVFNFSITDTTIGNKLIVKVRHTVDYEFQNLFLFLSRSSEQTDTVELSLAYKSGEWLGTGIGDVRELEFEYEQVVFSKKGEYTFEIEQAMRYGKLEKIQNLNHVSAIGFSIQKQDE